MRRSVLVVTSLLLLANPLAARADEGEIIVQREPGLSSRERAELRADAGVKLVSTLPLERTELDVPRDGDVADALAALRADREVVSAELDTPVHAAAAPNDFYWNSLWGLSNANDTDIDAPEAWSRGFLGEGVTVGVVDTGINAGHDELAGQLASNAGEQPANGVDDDHNGYVDDAQGWDFVSHDDAPQDANGHGSHVSGTIAATGNNGVGLIGVAPQARILPIRVLDGEGSGWMSDIAAGFDYAADLGVPIISASLGGSRSDVLENVIADHPNTLFVVAAGNDGADARETAPCALPEANIVCVGATDQDDKPASFSNYSPTSVDLSAPGVSIVSAWKDTNNAYRVLSGTSMATPHVAGAAALALSAHPGANSAQLKWALLSSVDVKPALNGTSVTGGRLNADAAVGAITGPVPALAIATPTPTPSPTPAPTTAAPVATASPAPVPVSTPAPAAPAPVAVPPTPPPAAPAPAAAPALSKVKIVRKGSKLRVTFALTRAATVRFGISKHGKQVAAWTRHGRAGTNVLSFRRTLKRGAYTLALRVSARASAARVIRVR